MKPLMSSEHGTFIDEPAIFQTLELAGTAAAAAVRAVLAKARELHGLEAPEIAVLMNLSDPALLGELFAAAQLVKLANRFQSEVFLVKDGQEVNGKSIMGVLMLAATQGSTIAVRAEGDDAEPALKAIGDLVQAGFGEGR